MNLMELMKIYLTLIQIIIIFFILMTIQCQILLPLIIILQTVYIIKNNEIKVLKNHKAVYVNRYLLKSPSSSKNLKKLNKIAFIGKTKRSSRYRGVSRNGNQWQVLIMLKRGKSYVGSYTSEEFAARIYDILAIKYRGIKARTNFKYSSEQIKTISETDIDIKSKDINDFISKFKS